VHRALLYTLNNYSMWWWRVTDIFFGIAILLCLFILTILPLAKLQATLLFHRSFALLVEDRNRKREFVSELLL
jgi:hypothetical protein